VTKFTSIGNWVVFAAGLFCGLYYISLSVVGTDFAYFPGDFIDGRFNNYILEHCYRYFTGKTPEFWNAPFMYPEENVITYSDNLLGSAPFYMLFRALGANRETAFQFWFLLVAALNYTSCFLFLRYLFKNAPAAVCGAMVFAFSLALQSQMGHAQTFPRYAIPLAFLFLLKFYEQPKPQFFLAALLMLVYQMYCGIYLGFLLAVPFGVFVLLMLVARYTQFAELVGNRRWLLKMAASCAVSLLLLLPLLLPYFARSRQMGFYPFDQVLSTLPTPGSYFFSWKGSNFWDVLSETCISYPAFWDHEIFSGAFASLGFFLSLLLVLAGVFYKPADVWSGGDMRKRLLILCGFITFVLFLRLSNFSLYRFVYIIPGFGSMRALQRIINVELLFFAAGLTGLLHLLTKGRPLLALCVALLLVPAIIADNYVNPAFIHHKEVAVSQQRVQPLVDQMQGLLPQTIVCYEPDTMVSQPMDYHLDGMLAAQQMGFKTLNGYSATSPGGYGPYWMKPNGENRAIWLERKGRQGLRVHVVK